MADGVTLGISEQCDYHLLEQSSEGAEALSDRIYSQLERVWQHQGNHQNSPRKQAPGMLLHCVNASIA